LLAERECEAWCVRIGVLFEKIPWTDFLAAVAGPEARAPTLRAKRSSVLPRRGARKPSLTAVKQESDSQDPVQAASGQSSVSSGTQDSDQEKNRDSVMEARYSIPMS
jgi:hypothetical protein